MRAITAVLLFVLAAATTSAQRVSVWKHFTRPDWGAGLLFHSLASSDTVAANNIAERVDITNISALVGVNLPFFQFSDNLSSGLNPNIEFSVALNSTWDQVFTFEAPIYWTLKYGTDATWGGSNGWLGGTIGVGYRHVFFVTPDRTYSFGLPNVMAELSIGKRRGTLGLLKLRYSLSLGSHDQEVDYNDGGPLGHIVFTNHAFHLLFTPGY